MELAKPSIDVGIYTNQRDEQLTFWQEQAGLEFEEMLKVGGGTQQHRHNLNGSVLKMNHTRNPLNADNPSGLKKLLIAKDDLTETVELEDPDGNQVALVPRGHKGVEQIGMVLNVSSVETFQRFYRDILQIEEITPTSYRWGNTLFFIEPADQPVQPGEMNSSIGYRYLTVQVFAVDKEHKAFVERGGTSGVDPLTLGTTARISFIKDPDGNWIEISQRASLTGSLEIVE